MIDEKALIYKLRACKGYVSLNNEEAEHVADLLESLQETILAFVTRDETGWLHLHTEKPDYKSPESGQWVHTERSVREEKFSLFMHQSTFMNVRWEDPEPSEVYINLKPLRKE